MDRFRIESQILYTQPTIKHALDASGIGYFLKDATLQYVDANQNLLDLYQLDDISKASDSELFGTNLADEFQTIESKILTTELPDKQEFVVKLRNKDQKVLRINRSIYKAGDQIFISGFVEDITDEKQAEQFDAFQEVLTQSEKYEKILNRFSSYIFNNNDLEVILNGVSKLCVDLLDLEDVSVFLMSGEQELIEQRSVYNSDHQFMYEESSELRLELGEGVIGTCAKQMKTLLINDVSNKKEYIKHVFDAKSELAVPIVYRQKLIGVINSESSHKHFFTPRHQQIIEGIASLLAIKLNELENSELLKRKHRQLEAFVENSPVALIMLDSDFHYLAISETWKKIFKINSKKNLLGKNHFEINKNVPIRWKNMIVATSQDGEPREIQKEFYKRKDGSHEWFTAKVSPWFTDSNELGGVIIMAEVITEKVEQELHLSETFEELQEARKLGKLFTWEFDPTSGKFIWSANIKEFGSGKLKDLGEISLFDLIEPEFKADFSNKIATAIDERDQFELMHPIRLHEEKYWLHTRGTVDCEGGKIVKIHGTVQDITEQMSVEQSLKSKNEELSKINDELDQFVYKTAHDLRAPLTNLLGLISVMKNETDPNLLRTYFDLQEKSVEKMDGFIQKITSYTRNARTPVTEQQVDCFKLTDEVFGEYLFYDKSDRVEKIIDIQNEIDIYTDPERLRIIISNLTANAIKFADMNKQHPSLAVMIETKFDEIHIQVKDNGIGIAHEIQDKVFDMFYRGHNTADGAGIGLYIVKETVKKLNGKISLISDLNKGTTVDIFIPNLNPNILK